MEQLLTVASAMVAGGKADLKMLNGYLRDYNDLVFGKSLKNKKVSKNEKEELFENLKGFRSMFGEEKITFKPKVGKKFDKEVSSISIQDLLKLEKN